MDIARLPRVGAFINISPFYKISPYSFYICFFFLCAFLFLPRFIFDCNPRFSSVDLSPHAMPRRAAVGWACALGGSMICHSH